jgi:hypothetical protein
MEPRPRKVTCCKTCKKPNRTECTCPRLHARRHQLNIAVGAEEGENRVRQPALREAGPAADPDSDCDADPTDIGNAVLGNDNNAEIDDINEETMSDDEQGEAAEGIAEGIVAQDFDIPQAEAAPLRHDSPGYGHRRHDPHFQASRGYTPGPKYFPYGLKSPWEFVMLFWPDAVLNRFCDSTNAFAASIGK